MKRMLVAALLAGATSVVSAAPIALPSGPVFIQFNNMEQVSLSNTITNSLGTNMGNWGVFNISSMQFGGISTPHQDISGGPTFFADDGPGGTQGQAHGVFYDITNTVASVGPPTVLHGAGGVLDIYWSDAGSDDITAADLSGGAGPNESTITQFTSGTLVAELFFMPGIISGDATTNIVGEFDSTTLTGKGSADSFADVNLVAGGAWSNSLNGNWFFVDVNNNGTAGESGEQRDLRFGNFTNGLSSWNGPAGTDFIGLRSNDPARVLVVPEPGSLVLFGLGALVLAMFSRRLRS